MRFQIFIILAIVLAVFATSGDALFGSALAAYSAMQPACAAGVVACYTAAGATFGVTCGLAAGPAVLACDVGFGACQASAAKAAGAAFFLSFF